MRVLMLWDADYPWDIRVNKITRTLFRHGFNVSVVCRNLNRLPTFENIDGVKFYRLPFFKNRHLNNILSFPFFLNFFWLQRIYTVAKKEKIQVLMVRDLPLAISAIIIGKILKVPVIIDMAENYPAMMKDSRKYGKFKFSNYLIRNIFLVNIVERYAIKRIQQFVVVTEENKNRLVQKGVSENRIHIVSNTPDLDEYKLFGATISESETKFYQDRFTLVYVGGLGPIRGLELVVQAMPELIRRIPEVHLLLIGKGEKRSILENLAIKHQVLDRITFKGWVDFKYVSEYLKCARVGIIPHLLTEHTNTTIPNKIFDYMAFGLPVVASDTVPMKRVIQQVKCGAVFAAGNLEGFIRAVYFVSQDTFNTFGHNGRKSVSEQYNWDEDSKVLLSMFQDM